MNCIIYCRKSTDREDKQAISLEHQMETCRNSAARNGLEIVQVIQESRSAKTKGTRPLFNKMIETCDSGMIDFIIVDEMKRLSRNSRDGVDILDLLDEWKIKGIITTSKTYYADSPDDSMMLSILLVLGKKENQDRARDTKAKMQTTIRNTGRQLSKVPIGYRNITIKKWQKEVQLIENEAKFVKKAFEMRRDGKSLKEIIAEATICGVMNRAGKPLSEQHIGKILENIFYYGDMKWSGETYRGSHTPIISRKLYDEANDTKRVYESRDKDYLFQKMIKDIDGIGLSPYTQKWKYVYYHTQMQSREKINLSEEAVFSNIEYQMNTFLRIEDKFIEDIFSRWLTRQIEWFKEKFDKTNMELLQQKNELEKRKGVIGDRLIDKTIDMKLYNEKIAECNKSIMEIEKKMEEYQFDEVECKNDIQRICELMKSFSRRYKDGNRLEKIQVLKSLKCELIAIDGKNVIVKPQDCYILCERLIETIETLERIESYKKEEAEAERTWNLDYKKTSANHAEAFNIFIGNATENWTPAYGMKTRCPNH